MAKEQTTVTMKHGGKEIDITKPLDEITKMTQIAVEAQGQIEHLFQTHYLPIYKALKTQGGELDIALKVKLKLTSETCTVVTDIGYTVEKVKDSLDAVVRFNQAKLFNGEKKEEKVK